MALRRPKPLHVLLGVVGMGLFVAAGLFVLTRYAGAWGVPYFSFTTERGSPCRNGITGYTCEPLTLADVEYYGFLDLPDDTTVTTATYRSTHDYTLEATLHVPKRSAGQALKNLRSAFGGCHDDHLSTLPSDGLRQVCVMANDDTLTESGEPSGRLYTVGTGVAKDGSRTVALIIKSR